MNIKPLDIFLLHNKKETYLSYTIKRLKTLHPSDTIHLFGTKYNNCYRGIKHHMIEDYMMSANEFQTVYLHLSTNFYSLELICFQRWFILKDFCETHTLDGVFLLDSDMLCCKSLHVFDDMITGNYDIGGMGIHSYLPSYIRVSSLQKACAYMLGQYVNSKRVLDLCKDRVAGQKFPGGINDTTLLGKFIKETKSLRIYDMGDVEKYPVVKEGCLTAPDNYFKDIEYVMVDGENNTRRKKVIFKNGSAYIERVDTHELQEVQSLHLQGATNKRLAALFYDELTGKRSLYKGLRVLTTIIVRILTIMWRISRKTTNTLQRIMDSLRL